MTLGKRVLVCSFGQHHGRVIARGDHPGWLRVRLDDGRLWHGHRNHLRAWKGKTRAAHAEYTTLES